MMAATDSDLTDLARRLLADSARTAALTLATEPWEEELLAPPPVPCAACRQSTDWHWVPLLLRRWPLDGLMLCARCWGARAAAEVVEQWRPGRGVTVLTRHPGGDVLRGTIRPVGLGRPRLLLVADYDHRGLGVHALDYVDALALLLDATAELNPTDTDPTEKEN